MYHSIFTLLITCGFFAVVRGGFLPNIPGRTCPIFDRSQLYGCVAQMDANADGILTVAEIDTFLANNTACLGSLATSVNGTVLVTMCDMDASGNLTFVGDWNVPGACMSRPIVLNMMCRVCDRCGYFVKKKK